ncbi:D-allose transport ATP-binding protein [Escherichia coli]|nr:D-allose transport ATP-binding protein [Escherichia coli]
MSRPKAPLPLITLAYNKLDHKLAAQLGIGIIYQELSVIDELTVLENLYIGRHLTKKNLWRQYYRLARNACPRRHDVITRGLES